MSTYILKLNGTEIIGSRVAIDGAIIPADSVAVTYQIYLDVDTIRAEMRADGRRDNPRYINETVVKPADSRTVIDVSIVESDVKLDQFANITITLTNAPNYSGTQYLNAFEEIFKFEFIDGVSSRADILFPNTGIFEFKSNATLRVLNSFNVRVYR